ncbi:hypothetical protein MKK75_11080 [Methylobacterium sp. J-030]|uniref:hypothetical protein n=1 Tax=Methylobacterium sp. J-030 TaxID=2836627 RepID=UPI001FBC1432|nr:hypothetical protein [Methylobacterium sp. J-030]MCJ2069337.1 hypothetical protein [Methylobacterium sp. J-030]
MTDDADATPKKRMGRPPKPASEVKRHGVAFRVNDRLREQIHKSAEENQRSVAEEVEYRLQLSAAIIPLVEEMSSDKITKELFRTISKTLKNVRIIAKRANLNEIDTRVALKRAFDHISDIYFWTGGEIASPPTDYAGSMDRHPRKKHEMSPASIGFSAASEIMISNSIWDECVAIDDFNEAIVDYWSGDGKTSLNVQPVSAPEPSGRSLEEILAEINPRDRKPSAEGA